MKFLQTILLLFLSIAMIQGTFLRGEDEDEDRRELTDDDQVAKLRPREDQRYCVRPERFRSGANLLMTKNCSGRKARFIMEERSGGFVRFVSRYRQRYCIEAVEVEDGARVRLQRCRGTSKQRWDFKSNGRIHPKDDDELCLVFQGDSLNRGDHLKLLHCDTVEDQEDGHGNDDQRWYTGDWDL